MLQVKLWISAELVYVFVCVCDYLSYLCEDANDCEFKVNDGISLYMRSTIYCFGIVPLTSTLTSAW